ncbi:SCO family protein [Sphingomonas sp. LY54]|uniref:SCO family protein n=1 Tax=Sphingomonas sp. LY54 TaxID=3095343 RepID=UPI002D77E71C|nr:SCO family protein [Sphingomonas sp. LY54]WRP27378.1 SCO family protein [Sphingomonas sp. LY54]
MNERRFLASLALLLTLLLGACGPKAEETPPLAGASLGGPFTLTDQDGKQVSDTDFDGRYRLVYFGFTYCPDVCPVDLQVIGQGFRQLEKSDPAIAAKVQPIFISVDPERDTPPVVKEFVSAFHPRLVGLTGTPEQIAEVAKRYGIYYIKEQSEGASGYLVNHSRNTVLFGPKGEPIAIVPHDQGPETVAAELKRWVK